MKKIPHKHKSKKIRHAPPGSAPGILNIPEDAPRPVIHVFIYNEKECREEQLFSTADMLNILQKYPGMLFWFDIHGFGDKKFLEQLSDSFSIHRLQMEDVVNVYQRPKADESQGPLFLISRVLSDKDGMLQNDQLSIFSGSNFLISLQEHYEDILDPVRVRVRTGKGFMRVHGIDYLVYSLMDAALDNYYPLLEKTGDKLDDLQEELLAAPTREALNRVLQIKRDLIVMRRSIWSERDKINDILRSNFAQVKDEIKIFYRDSYDHCIQIMDLVESYKEVTASLMDVYHSSVSNRLNQVMKVLTIISTIFIPLTFIVGVYGMNFAGNDPATGKSLPWNMPELYSPYGYIGVMVFMLLIVVAQILFFRKKGWLSKS